MFDEISKLSGIERLRSFDRRGQLMLVQFRFFSPKISASDLSIQL